MTQAKRSELSATPRVLIVGAGPTGLALAVFLSRHGIRPTLVDSSSGPARESRALAMHARTLETLGPGLAGQLVDRGNIIDRVRVWSAKEQLASLDFNGAGAETAYPFVLGLSQSLVEQALIEELAETGIGVAWNTRLTGLQDPGDHAQVALHPVSESPEPSALSSWDWVIGCDGVHSQVRDLAGIGISGAQMATWWLLADITLSGRDVPQPHEALLAFARGRMLALLPIEDGWWRVIATEGNDDPPQIDRELIQDLLVASPWEVALEEDTWISRFKIREQVARHYRNHERGRVLLAGDAAHAHSPLGGQGMNTGIQDGANLAWKLALAGTDTTHPLVASYEAERRPVATTLVANTGRGTRAVLASSTWAEVMRSTALDVLLNSDWVTQRARAGIEMLSVSYPHSPVVNEEVSSSVERRIGQLKHGLDGAKQMVSGPSGEGPSRRDRARLRQAAGPGQPVRHHVSQVRELLARAEHVALVFDANPTHDGYQRMDRLAASIQGDEHFYTVLVVRSEHAAKRVRSQFDQILVDPEGVLEREFGVSSETLFIVRPDGVVGFRSAPIELSALHAWWYQQCGMNRQA